jgi:hypothetical protein
VEDAAVGWVVKQWRTDAARDRAERDARRARRAADRATASVAAQVEALNALERLATELLVTVGRQRAIDREATGSAVPALADAPDRAPRAATAPADDVPPQDPAPAQDAALSPHVAPPPVGPQPPRRAPRRRTDRASLRGSGLGELFRATGPGPAGAPPPPG